MKTIGSLGLIRGLIAQIIGTALGMGLVMLIRQFEGKPAWKDEPVIVIGALIGAIAFLVGVGIFEDWFKWVKGEETPIHHGPPEDRPAWTRYFSVDYSQSNRHPIHRHRYFVDVVRRLSGHGLSPRVGSARPAIP